MLGREAGTVAQTLRQRGIVLQIVSVLSTHASDAAFDFVFRVAIIKNTQKAHSLGEGES